MYVCIYVYTVRYILHVAIGIHMYVFPLLPIDLSYAYTFGRINIHGGETRDTSINVPTYLLWMYEDRYVYMYVELCIYINDACVSINDDTSCEIRSYFRRCTININIRFLSTVIFVKYVPSIHSPYTIFLNFTKEYKESCRIFLRLLIFRVYFIT